MAVVNLENKKQIVIIVFAVGAGIIASALIGNYVSSKVNEETKKLAFQYEKAEAQKEKMYKDQMAGMSQKIAEVEARAQKAAEDAVKAVAAQKAAPVNVVKKQPSLALRTPVGKRAITVQIESLGAVGGLLNPGDFVDVIAHLSIPTGKKLEPNEKVTAMIFQNLQVLAVNTNIDEPGAYDVQQKENSLKVTFAVNPQEAGLLAFSEQNGKLEFALRTPTEKGRMMIPAANWSTLAEYVLENSGAEIKTETVAEIKADLKVETESIEEAKPYIQIFRGGREL